MGRGMKMNNEYSREYSMTIHHQPKQARSYQRWNTGTATCYAHNCTCTGCPNEDTCNSYVYAVNEYGIKPMKYATIKTYQNIGEADYKNWL
jgi:hypothetical protein